MFPLLQRSPGQPDPALWGRTPEPTTHGDTDRATVSPAYTTMCILSLVRTPTRQQLPPRRASLCTRVLGAEPTQVLREGLERKGLEAPCPSAWQCPGKSLVAGPLQSWCLRPVQGSPTQPLDRGRPCFPPALTCPGPRGRQSRPLMAPAHLGSSPVRAGPGTRAVSQPRPMPPGSSVQSGIAGERVPVKPRPRGERGRDVSATESLREV